MLPVSLVEMVTSVAFDPSVWHPALAVTLSHIFAFLPRVTMLGVVPVPVARRIDVAFTYRRIFDYNRWRRDLDIYVDPRRARQRRSEQ